MDFKKVLRWLRLLPPAEEPLPPSPIQEAISRYTEKDPPDMGAYRDRRRISVLIYTIDAYTDALRVAHEALAHDRPYRLPWPMEEREVTISDFYTLKDGQFSDPTQLHERFMREVIKYLHLYEERSEEHGLNANMTNTVYRQVVFVNNLIALSERL